MSREEVFERVTEVFRDVFDDETIELADTTTAEDIEEWDSLEHVSLMLAIGSEFGIKIPLQKVNSMKNVGEMVDYIQQTV
ncbi:MAG: acyl carrier protein [Lachnospiraceae bacterium]|jgi:acyl carrier protein|nr:acyl carrier protein [Lachnospiraceae bacterium]